MSEEPNESAAPKVSHADRVKPRTAQDVALNLIKSFRDSIELYRDLSLNRTIKVLQTLEGIAGGHITVGVESIEAPISEVINGLDALSESEVKVRQEKSELIAQMNAGKAGDSIQQKADSYDRQLERIAEMNEKGIRNNLHLAMEEAWKYGLFVPGNPLSQERTKQLTLGG